MNQLKQDDMRQHVTIVGWLYIIGHVFFIVIGGFVFVLLQNAAGEYFAPQQLAS